jgi:hypothetical protein
MRRSPKPGSVVEPVHRGWRSNRDTEAYQRRAGARGSHHGGGADLVGRPRPRVPGRPRLPIVGGITSAWVFGVPTGSWRSSGRWSSVLLFGAAVEMWRWRHALAAFLVTGAVSGGNPLSLTAHVLGGAVLTKQASALLAEGTPNERNGRGVEGL